MKLTAHEAEAWQRLCAKEALAEALCSRASIRCETWQPAALRVSDATRVAVIRIQQSIQDEKNYFLDSIILAAKREADRG